MITSIVFMRSILRSLTPSPAQKSDICTQPDITFIDDPISSPAPPQPQPAPFANLRGFESQQTPFQLNFAPPLHVSNQSPAKPFSSLFRYEAETSVNEVLSAGEHNPAGQSPLVESNRDGVSEESLFCKRKIQGRWNPPMVLRQMELSPVLPSPNIPPDYLVGELTRSVYRLQLQRNAMDRTKTLSLSSSSDSHPLLKTPP